MINLLLLDPVRNYQTFLTLYILLVYEFEIFSRHKDTISITSLHSKNKLHKDINRKNRSVHTDHYVRS